MTSKDKFIPSFSDNSIEDWRAIAEKSLKGRALTTLSWPIAEDIKILPYFTKATANRVFEGGIKPDDTRNNWSIVERISTANPKDANQKALTALQHGASVLEFDGPVDKREDFAQLLKDIQTDIISVYFNGANPKKIEELARESSIRLNEQNGGWLIDPLGKLTETTELEIDPKTELNALADSLNRAQAWKNWKCIQVNGGQFHHAGAAVVQELAFSLACSNEYFHQLKERAVKPEELAKRFVFSFSMGSTYFLEIAKLRAAAVLWDRMISGYEINTEDFPIYIRCETSLLDRSPTERQNNMLRSTTQAMSAIIGGCRELYIHPHTYAEQDDIDFAKRTARNVHHLLQHESHLNEVIDPAKGAYFIEELSAKLVDAAWELFLETEKRGGYLQAIETGWIQSKIKHNAKLIVGAIESGEKTIVGVNKYILDPTNNNNPMHHLGKAENKTKIKPLASIVAMEKRNKAHVES